MDFDRKFPQYKEKLLISWNVNFEKFFTYFKKNLSAGGNIYESLMNAQHLNLGKYSYIKSFILIYNKNDTHIHIHMFHIQGVSDHPYHPFRN